MAQRLRVHRRARAAETALRIGERAFHHADHVLHRHRFELENLRTRNERRVDVEIRVVRRRPDEPNNSALDVRQQHVLLRLVETVDLVDEQDRRFPAQLAPGARLVDLRADLRDVRLHAVERLETRAGRARDHAGERGFPRARRTVENQRGEAVALDRAAQQLARRENVLLARHLVERARPHPRRQGLGRNRFARMRGGNFKKVGHSGCPLPSTATHPTASQNHGITHISAMRPRR